VVPWGGTIVDHCDALRAWSVLKAAKVDVSIESVTDILCPGMVRRNGYILVVSSTDLAIATRVLNANGFPTSSSDIDRIVSLRNTSSRNKIARLLPHPPYLQILLPQRFLQLHRPLPRLRFGIVLDVETHLARKGEGDGLRHVEDAQHVQENRTLPV